MKKIISMLLAITLLFAIVPMGVFAAELYGDYEFDKDTGTITGYNGSGGDLVIPAQIDGVDVTAIGDMAFSSCYNLTSITILDGVTRIGRETFAFCTSLSSITIPDSVISIGHDAFSYCRNLTALDVAENNDCYSSEDGVLFDKDKKVLITCPEGKTGAYDIPNGVTSIGYAAFNNCTSLASVTIPDGVTIIGNSAFSHCSSLTSVTIGNGVTTIGDLVFFECYSLTNVTIGNGVTSIEGSFYWCTGLTSIEIPDSVTRIRGDSFYYCSSLTAIDVAENNDYYSSEDGVLFDKDKKVLIICPAGKTDPYSIPDGVTSIGDYAFYYCESLTGVIIPDSVTSIGGYAFDNCKSLTSIEIPNGVTSIRGDSFYWCTSLTEINVAENNDYYSSEDGVLFDKDKKVLIACPAGKTGIYSIPDGVTSMDMWAFSRSNLTSVTIPGSVTRIGDWVFSDSALTSVTIKNGVTSIGNSAFYWCGSLTNVKIPDSVTSIEGWAFFYCTSLASVTIPEGVTSIGFYAFERCESLTSVYFTGDAPTVGNEAFYDVAPEATAYVRRSSTGFPAEGQLWNGLTVRYYDHLVTFVDWNGAVLNIQAVDDGDGAAAPPPPERDGYTFVGWDQEFSHVAGDMTITAVYAPVGDPDAPKITISSATARPGDTISLPITLEDNPGLVAMRLFVDFDSEFLTLESVVDGQLLGTAYHRDTYNAPYTLYWENATIHENIRENGTIATLNFKVAEDAPEGSYDITLSYDYDRFDIIDVDLKPVFFEPVNGVVDVIKFVYGNVRGGTDTPTPADSVLLSRYLARWPDVTILEAAADVDLDGGITPRDALVLRRHIANWSGYETLPYPLEPTASPARVAQSLTALDAPSINVSSVEGKIGDTIDVPISLTDNPGLVAMRLFVDFDSSALRLVDVIDKGGLGVYYHSNNYTSPYTLYWENATIPENITYNGDIAVLRFEVISDAGSEVSVRYDFNKYDIIDVDLNPVFFETNSGFVTSPCNHNEAKEGTVTVEPTCTEAGERTFFCTACEESLRTEAMPALGHDHVKGTYTAPVGTEDGYWTLVCPRCGDSYSEPFPKPTASVVSGSTVEKGSFVVFSTTTSGAEIYYTTDGSDPCLEGSSRILYTGPIEITKTVTILAAAHKEGMEYSATATFAYYVNVVLSSISMKASPTKTIYNIGQALDLTGGKITLHYSDGTSEERAITADMISGYDKNKIGNQTVTVTYQGKSATFSVTVTQPVSGVTLNKETLSLKEDGAKETLTATVSPSTASNKNVTWSSSVPSVATVTNGVVTPLKAGKTTVTVTTVDGGKTATCEVTVTAVVTPVSGVTLNKATLSLKVGGAKGTLTAAIRPSTASNKKVTWSSSVPSVATVANGVVTPLKAGKTTIMVTTVDGKKTAKCEVTVASSQVPVTGVSIVSPPANVVNDKTKTVKLKATVKPANATNKTVTWSSNNTKVATVNKTTGTLTPVGPGTVTITATAGGKSTHCKITIHQYVSLRVGFTKAIKNGNPTTIDNAGTKPFKISGRTMLPLRFVGEKMGGKVKYVNDKKPITMTYGGTTVEFMLNSKTMQIIRGNKTQTVQLDVAAQKKGGKTYIPLRAISQALGFQVYYEAKGEYIVVNNPAMSTTLRSARIKEAKGYIK